MPTPSPLRTAIAGIGGFAVQHHTTLLAMEAQGCAKVVATCDPRATKDLGEQQESLQLEQRGVAVYEQFDEMMAKHGDALDLLTVSSPIRFHAPMHRAAVERGIACYLEKPPTLDPVELEEMIALDATAKVPSQVGFNYIYQPFRKALSARIHAGEFGKLTRLNLEVQWPRDTAYYQRNNWAGGLMLGDYILLDSCCGNAASHHLQNILYFAGPGYSLPLEVESEIYRANAINGVDTIFSRGTLQNGVAFRIAATHACNGNATSIETIECENATITLLPLLKKGQIVHKDGTVEELDVTPACLEDNIALYSEIAQGSGGTPPVTLAECRAFVALNALFYIAAGKITTVGTPHAVLEAKANGEEKTINVIHGISEACKAMIATGALPSEQGLPWGAAGGTANISQLGELRTTLQAMLAQA